MALITSTIQNVDVAKLKHEIESAGNYKVQSITVTSTGVDVVVLTPTGADISEGEADTLKTSVIDAHQSQQRRRILVKDAPVNDDEATNLATINSTIDERIAELVDGAPDVLNTLNELSNALGDDPNFATTIANQIGDISDTTSAIDIRVQAVESDVVTLSSSIQQESVDRVAGDLDTLTTAQSYTNTQVDALEDTLATVATTGSYNDLTNKPTISTAGSSGSYTDLTNKPTIPSAIDDLSDVAVSAPATNQLLKFNGTQWVNAQSYFGTGSYNDLNDKPSLATVATTGSYNDLNNKPSLATVATTGSYNDLTNQPTLPSAIPTGMLAPFAGAVAPTSWLMCDGSAVSRSTYSTLFSTIGVSYGSGDGTTTFNVPDLRRRTPVGKGTSDSLGSSDGVAEASRLLTQSHSIPAHYHGMGAGATLNITSSGSGTSGIESVGHTHTVSGTTGNDSPDHAHSGSTSYESADHAHYVSGSTASDGSHNHLIPTSRGSGLNTGSPSGRVDKNDGGTVSSTGTVDSGTTSSTHSHAIGIWSGGVNANHYHTFTTYGRSAFHQHAFSTSSGDVSANHTHAIPNHTHGSANFSGSIGLVTGGVDGNAAMTSGTQTLPHLIVNYIIKT